MMSNLLDYCSCGPPRPSRFNLIRSSASLGSSYHIPSHPLCSHVGASLSSMACIIRALLYFISPRVDMELGDIITSPGVPHGFKEK